MSRRPIDPRVQALRVGLYAVLLFGAGIALAYQNAQGGPTEEARPVVHAALGLVAIGVLGALPILGLLVVALLRRRRNTLPLDRSAETLARRRRRETPGELAVTGRFTRVPPALVLALLSVYLACPGCAGGIPVALGKAGRDALGCALRSTQQVMAPLAAEALDILITAPSPAEAERQLDAVDAKQRAISGATGALLCAVGHLLYDVLGAPGDMMAQAGDGQMHRPSGVVRARAIAYLEKRLPAPR